MDNSLHRCPHYIIPDKITVTTHGFLLQKFIQICLKIYNEDITFNLYR